MSVHEFLGSAAIIVAIMAAIAVFELVVPMAAGNRPLGQRATANLGLTALTLVLNWALTSVAAVIALALPPHESSLTARSTLSFTVEVALSVALLDFSFGYLAHRAMHLSPTLWRAHRVHHCDPFVDATTTYRTHPIEGVWRYLFVIVPVWALGLPAEAVAIHRLLSAVNGIFEHANLRVAPRFDRLLSTVWVTPHMHKVHHSRRREETDSNYGNILSIYDRWLGTFTPTQRTAAYGLDNVGQRRATSLAALLAMPFHSEVNPIATPPAPQPT